MPELDESKIMEGKMLSLATRVLEGFANRNSFSDLVQDFKYWDDDSDALPVGEGTFLQLLVVLLSLSLAPSHDRLRNYRRTHRARGIHKPQGALSRKQRN